MQDIQQILESLPSQYRGPGGAIAVLKEGHLVGQHVWGFADLENRIPLSNETLMPICSITKQMVCAVLKDLDSNPTPKMVSAINAADAYSVALRALLPAAFELDTAVTMQHLCNNQSGIRDYWAMTLLWGAVPEGRFSLDDDARWALQYIKSLHFKPGTQYAYGNTNFYILARAIEKVSGRSIGDLLSERVFVPAGMTTAHLCPDTAAHPGPCIGYEGNDEQGYVRARNRVEWSGDAGVVASLKDMVAYEAYLDSQWRNPASVYRSLAEQPLFDDGTPANYGNGLAHAEIGGIKTIGHGGALRGFRLQRLYVPTERLSVVVMFNHEADPLAAAEFVLRDVLSLRAPIASSIAPDPTWFGDFLDPASQLAIRVAPIGTGEISLSYAGYPERLHLVVPGRARSREMEATIDGEHLLLRRTEDNRVIRAARLRKSDHAIPEMYFQGTYHCAELDSTFHCYGTGAVFYGAFDGFLGNGPGHRLQQLSTDVWVLKCPRGMDAPAPGDWTLVLKRDDGGLVTGVTVSCWLARDLKYQRVNKSN